MADEVEFTVHLGYWTKGVALSKGICYSVSADHIWGALQEVFFKQHDRPDKHTHHISISQIFKAQEEEGDGADLR